MMFNPQKIGYVFPPIHSPLSRYKQTLSRRYIFSESKRKIRWSTGGLSRKCHFCNIKVYGKRFCTAPSVHLYFSRAASIENKSPHLSKWHPTLLTSSVNESKMFRDQNISSEFVQALFDKFKQNQRHWESIYLFYVIFLANVLKKHATFFVRFLASLRDLWYC